MPIASALQHASLIHEAFLRMGDKLLQAKLYSPTGSALLNRYPLFHATNNYLLFFVSPTLQA